MSILFSSSLNPRQSYEGSCVFYEHIEHPLICSVLFMGIVDSPIIFCEKSDTSIQINTAMQKWRAQRQKISQ